MDFIGLLIIIVYVGAIAILFLFVVMMINIKNEEINRTKYVPIALIVAIVLMIEVYIQFPLAELNVKEASYAIDSDSTNINNVGLMLFS